MTVTLGAWLHARLPRGEHGATLVEYLLLVSLIAIAVIGAVIFLGGALRESFNGAGSELSNITP